MNKLFLNKNIFEEAMVKLSIKAFDSIAHITLSQNENYFICLFYKCLYDIEETKKEFENYLIDLTNSHSVI